MVLDEYSRVWIVTTCLAFSIQAYAVIPYLSYRSASVDAARELVGWQTQINKATSDDIYGSLAITPIYNRSLQSDQIAKRLFGKSLMCHDQKDCLAFKIQGSKVPNRNKQAWLADYFYLPTDFQSMISIDPSIDTFIFDLNFYCGLNACLDGLYFRIHAPICSTRFDLNFCEGIIDAGTNGYDAGYYCDDFSYNKTTTTVTGVKRNILLKRFEAFVFNKDSITEIPTLKCNTLNYARMSPFRLTTTKISDIQCALGWNFLLDSDYHLGLEFRGCIPTGNRPHGQYIFEPIVGNGHHGELGIGVTVTGDVGRIANNIMMFLCILMQM